MLAIELAAYLDRVRPRRILEVGSGFSTAILAAYAAHHDAEVVTLEHDLRYLRITARALRRLGVDRPVDLKLAPLSRQGFGENGPYWWYGVELEGEFDFVFIDGPPKVLGRRGAFFALQGHLRAGWQVWVDDGSRRHEQQCVKLWERQFSGVFRESRRDIDGKGVFVLSDAKGGHGHARDRATHGRLGIGILGNGDPNWWSQTEKHLGSRLLESSYVIVVDRGEPSERELPKAATKFIDEPVPADGRLRQRVLKMFGSFATQQDVRYVLYLDDQWSPSTLDGGWLSWGLDILKDQPDVDQVSLRHLVDVGVADKGEQRPFTTSFTGEPSLLRADRLGTVLQAECTKRHLGLLSSRSKPDLEPTPLRTIQLSPGVFRRSARAAGLAEATLEAVGNPPFPTPGGMARAAPDLESRLHASPGGTNRGHENRAAGLIRPSRSLLAETLARCERLVRWRMRGPARGKPRGDFVDLIAALTPSGSADPPIARAPNHGRAGPRADYGEHSDGVLSNLERSSPSQTLADTPRLGDR